MSWMSHVTHVIVMMNESCRTCDCGDDAAILVRDDVMDEMSHVTHVMSHI